MIVRGVGRAIAGLALVLAVSACDDNPLAENREDASYFRLNPSSAAVNAGGTVKVDATVLNRYGAATNAAVTGTPCDSRISAVADTLRSEYEFPERFTVTGLTLGLSCLVVTGGGITDTIQIRVVPASFDLTTSDTIASGQSATVEVAFLTEAGTPVTGFSATDVVWESVDESIGVVDENGVLTARAPGSGLVVAELASVYGAVRVDTVAFEVVPETFSGTATVLPYGASGLVVELQEGVIPFDENTYVALQADPHASDLVEISTELATRLALVPAGTAAGDEVSYYILNAGPNDVTVLVTIEATSDVAIDNTSSAGAAPLDLDEVGFGLIAGERGTEAWYEVTITEAGTYRVSFEWGDNQDKDLYVLDDGGATLLALESGAATNPESDTIDLDPGTYYLVGSVWTPNPGNAAAYRMIITRED